MHTLNILMKPMTILALMCLTPGLVACSKPAPSEHPKPSISTSAIEANTPSASPSPASETPTPSASASIADGGGDGDEAHQQGEDNPGEFHSLPVYNSMEDVAAYPKGIYVQASDDYALTDNQHIETLTKLIFANQQPYKGDPGKIANTLFPKLLYYFSGNYANFKSLHDYGYIIFKNDGTDPVTKTPLAGGTQVNLELVLDASGSMAKQINGRSMMDIAKESITKTLQQLPPNANVALRVYGHKGNNKANGKTESCASSDLIHPMAPLDTGAIQTQLNAIAPTGWTPLAESITRGAADFDAHQGDGNLNILYVISDGIETCDSDPILAATNLKQRNIKPVLGIIGFNVDPTQELHLREIANAGDGHYASANNADSLVKELEQIHSLANSNYDWQPIDGSDVDRVYALHARKRLYDSNDLIQVATSQQEEITSAIQTLTNDLKIIDRDTSKALQDLNQQNAARIRELISQAGDALKQEAEQMKSTYTARIGEEGAVINPELGE